MLWWCADLCTLGTDLFTLRSDLCTLRPDLCTLRLWWLHSITPRGGFHRLQLALVVLYISCGQTPSGIAQAVVRLRNTERVSIATRGL